MIQFLIESAEKSPQKPFIIYNEKMYDYEEFYYQVIHAVRVLQQQNISSKSLIGIHLENPFEFIIHWFACNYLGYISVLLNPKLKFNELKKHTNSVPLDKIITTRHSFKNQSLEMNKIIFIEDSSSISVCGNESKKINWDMDETITIIFTSGSDGFPNPVEFSQQNILASFTSWNEEIQFNKKDKLLNCLPLFHIAGISAVFRGLLSQTSVLLQQKFDLELFISHSKKYNISISSLVPTMIFRLLQSEGGIKCLQLYRMILIGGGPASTQLLEQCLQNEINIFVTYGMTETCSGVSGFWIHKHPDKLDSIGMAFKEMTVSLSNKNEEYSNICVLGENVANGYWGENRFNNQFFSNDLGKYDEDGFLYLKPLRKDRIVTGGENVNPLEVEDVILKIQEVQDCCVIGIEDFEWGEKIIAFVKCSKNLDKMDIIDFCSERILDYKIPKEIIFCEDLPQTELGKINRDKVNELLKDYGRT